MPLSCRPSRAATPIFQRSWSPRNWLPKSCATCGKPRPEVPLKLVGAFPRPHIQAQSADADIDVSVTDGDRDRGEPHRRIAGMAAGGQIEFVTMPRANDVALLAKAQPGAFVVGRDHFLDLVETLALTHRAAGVGTDVFIGKHFRAGAKDADFEFIDGEDPIIAIGDIGQFA